MNYHPSCPIIVSGIKHCGKSTIGRRLADELNLDFFDLDDCLVALCRKNRGGSDAITWEPREIYRRLGKTGFQELEYEALEELERQDDTYILALGGGTQDNPKARHILSSLGILVYLYEDAKILFSRIMDRGIPPFLDQKAPWESFFELFKRRDSLYRSSADIIIELKGADIQEGTTMILKELQEFDNVR